MSLLQESTYTSFSSGQTPALWYNDALKRRDRLPEMAGWM
jgi:hypothetical protein